MHTHRHSLLILRKATATFLRAHFTWWSLMLLLVLMLLINTRNPILKQKLRAKCLILSTYFCMTCHHFPSWSQSCSDRSVFCNCCWADRCVNIPRAFHTDPLHTRGFWLQEIKNSKLKILQRHDNFVHQYVECFYTTGRRILGGESKYQTI